MRTAARLSICMLACLVAAGCEKKSLAPMSPEDEDFDRPLPPGELALRKITDPADLPDLTMACEFTYNLREAVAHSLNYLSKPSSRRYFPYGEITHAHAAASLRAFDALLARPLPPRALHDEILRRFDVYTSVGWDGSGTVLFTSYYTPIFRASRTRTAEFRYPLYKPPPNLVKGPEGEVLGVRTASGAVRRLPPRRELVRSGMLDGLELVYLADPFEAYIAHVQGSAKLRMPDGELITVGYAAHNGHEYRSIAKEMIADGKMRKRDLSLARMIAYFKANPAEVRTYVDKNPRFVFFGLSSGPPRGSLNEPVTPMRSIATDKEVYPRACLAMISANLPLRHGGGIDVLPYKGFALDQDTGGAIRAPGRCDIYVGIGDEAGQIAGRTYSKGRLYYLFLKPSLLPRDVLSPTTRPRPANTPSGSASGS